MILLLAAILLTACSRDPQPPNIVLVVLDTTRFDRLSAYGYAKQTSPFLNDLAQRGTRFDRAWSVSSWTLPAHASLFTGVQPPVHGADQERHAFTAPLPTLAERLGQAGYQCAAFSNNPWVSRRTGLARGFDPFEEMWLVREQRTEAQKEQGHATVQAVRAWIDGTLDEDRPFFAFINLIEPHLPYRPPAGSGASFFRNPDSYQRALAHFEGAGELTARNYFGPHLQTQEWKDLKLLYEGELRQVDWVAGRVVRELEKVRGRKETIVIVISDHGEHHGEHGHLAHVFSLHEEVVRIPLLAAGPGFEKALARTEPASILDVHATILAAAGVKGAEEEGLDLRGELPAQRAMPLSYGWPRQALSSFPAEIAASPALAPYRRALWGATDGRYKLILGSDGTRQVFDLQADPNEQSPQAAPPADALAALEAAAARVQPGPAPAGVESGAMDPQTESALRELGYIE